MWMESWFGSLRRFRKDREAVSAVEFALLAPFMVTLLLSSIELTSGVIVDRKLAIVARTVADLTGRSEGLIDSAEMTRILAAGQTVLAPYSDTELKIVVSSIVFTSVSGTVTGKVAWSAGTTGAATLTPGDSFTADSSLRVANTSLIFAKADYKYMPPFGTILAKTGFNMAEQLFMRPRAVDKVCYKNSSGTTLCG